MTDPPKSTPLDIDAARLELPKLRLVNNQAEGVAARDDLQVAALLDIAESLRELAAYVNLVAPRDEPHPEPAEPTPAPLEVGDWVRRCDDDGVVYELTAIGVSEELEYGVLRVGESVETFKAWLDELERAPGYVGSPPDFYEPPVDAEPEPDSVETPPKKKKNKGKG